VIIILEKIQLNKVFSYTTAGKRLQKEWQSFTDTEQRPEKFLQQLNPD
jgi:hypothetical protein